MLMGASQEVEREFGWKVELAQFLPNVNRGALHKGGYIQLSNTQIYKRVYNIHWFCTREDMYEDVDGRSTIA